MFALEGYLFIMFSLLLILAMKSYAHFLKMHITLTVLELVG